MMQDDVALVWSGYLRPFRGNTLKTYEYHLGRWLDWCASRAVAPLDARRWHVEQYVHYLSVETPHQPGSVANALVPVRGFYRIAHNDGLVDRDPAAITRLPRVVRGRGTLGLDRHDMRALLRLGGQLGGRSQAAVY